MAELDAINLLEFQIEKRMREGAMPVKDVEGVELTEAAIDDRITVLASQLMVRYPDANPLLVTVLDGALPFASDMHKALARLGYAFNFSSITASSYGAGTSSTGCEVVIGSMPKIPVTGRTVVILDEVYDTGKTCAALRDKFRQAGAKDVAVMVLVDKNQPRPLWGDPELAGFQIDPSAFIVGKGLDYAGMLRNEPWIRAVDMSTLPTDEEKQRILVRKKELINEYHARPGESINTRAMSSPRSPLSGSSGSLSPRSPAAASPPLAGFFSSPDSYGLTNVTGGLLFGPGYESKAPGV